MHGLCSRDRASPLESCVRCSAWIELSRAQHVCALRRLLMLSATAKPAPRVACVEGSRAPSTRHRSVLPWSLPGLPPPAVIPDSPEGREPAVARLRGMVKVGTNALCWELFQLLLLL